MGNVRSFAEYEAAREQREEQFDEAVAVRLEKLVDQHDAVRDLKRSYDGAIADLEKNEKKRQRCVEVNAALDLYLQVWVGRTLLIGDYDLVRAEVYSNYAMRRAHNKEILDLELFGKAKLETDKNNFRENLTDLVRAAWSESGRKTMNEPVQRTFSSYFISEVQQLVDDDRIDELGDLPGITNLLAHPEFSDDIYERIPAAAKELKSKGYIKNEQLIGIKRVMTRHVIVEPQAQTPKPVRVDPKFMTLIGEPSVPTSSADLSEERLEFLQVMFDLPEEIAQNYVDEQTLETFEDRYWALAQATGSERSVPRLVKTNPGVLTYRPSAFSKFCSTMLVVRTHIESDFRTRDVLRTIYGIEQRLADYASFESLAALKHSLFNEKIVDGRIISDQVDIGAYRSALLERVSLPAGIIKGLTEGPNAAYQGEIRTSQRTFRTNVRGQVSKSDFRRFSRTFDVLVERGAIIEENGQYSLTVDPANVEGVYLHEYFRLLQGQDPNPQLVTQLLPDT
ncbi:MAG: hypothetical protein CMH61_00555 [Nanoarchaeota archaeon]|nr:hypothetical protein [Nanoarchaeota archaeon]|tara:strand:+ start:2524 stop:4047 length:1524 start_codon:yes stop_codon:yes gene_type:complete